MSGPVGGKWLLLEPMDVLLFRDGRPFQRGESRRASGRFPPLGTTVQGALRSRVRADFPLAPAVDGGQGHGCDEELAELLNPNSYGPLRLLGPFPFRGGSLDGGSGGEGVLLPPPMDVLAQEGRWRASSPVPGIRLKPAEAIPKEVTIGWPGEWAEGLRPLLSQESGGTAPDGLWISPGDLRQYLCGAGNGDAPFGLTPFPDLSSDPRTGIAIGRGRIAEPGMIYTVDFLRLAPGAGLALWVGGLDKYLEPWEGTVRLGGEGRSASYRPLDDDPSAKDLEALLSKLDEQAEDEITGSGRFKIYLASPAVFERNGWFPDDLHPGESGVIESSPGGEPGDRSDGEARTGIPGVRLVAAAVGKPLVVSGWRLAGHAGGAAAAPKPARLAVPPGSVFYFEMNNGQDDGEVIEALKRLHGTCISAGDAEVGLGLALVGAW